MRKLGRTPASGTVLRAEELRARHGLIAATPAAVRLRAQRGH